MECSKFHWPAVAGLKEQSSTRLVKEYNSCHFKNTATRHFFLLLQFLLINAIWHVESKKTLGTRLILMSSLSKFVKFFFKKKKIHDAASYQCAFSDWHDFGCYSRGNLPSVLCVKPKRSHGPFRGTP